jgi:nucleoid-associated protein YgaU
MTSDDADPAPIHDPAPGPVTAMPKPTEGVSGDTRPIASPAETATWLVRPGDNFWTIAARVLKRSWGRRPTDAEVDGYWVRLIELNRSQLADPHNPDLILPGQLFFVPPVPAAGG